MSWSRKSIGAAVLLVSALCGLSVAAAGPAYVVTAFEDDARPPKKHVRSPVKPASSWGEQLNPGGQVYPNGFKAFYFDRTKETISAFEHYSDTVAVKYAWDELHDISSDAFAAYWVGLVHADAAGSKEIAVSMSWSKARVFLNGELIYDGGGKKSFPASFRKGANLLEVEYINNWHTTEFKLTVGSGEPKIPMTHIGAALKSVDRPLGGIHYVGLYESSNRDTTVSVRLPAKASNAVVWLDSYEGIDWNVDQPEKVAAIFIASYSPGSRVVNAGKIPVFQVERGFGVRSVGKPGCHCSGAGFHCENKDDLADLTAQMKQLTGYGVESFGVTYSAAHIVTEPIDKVAQTRIEAAKKLVEQQKAKCEAKREPDFDTMFRS